MTDDQTVHLQRCLDRLQAGDTSARNDLLAGAVNRLERLARTMLRDYPRLKRWEETTDVLQSALIRLQRALETVTPASLREFYRLAALQVRRELIDLARHHFGPESSGIHRQSGDGERPPFDPASSTYGPDRLAVWAEFHEQVSRLPEDEQEVFDLVWYQELTHDQAAELLNISTKTVQRRWLAARLKLHEALGGNLPE
jgi:RNA polymerase sigma-70 factor (ECF subfamily)